jgi:hypothetical protein
VISALCSANEKDFAAQARENSIKHHIDITVGYRYQSSSRHFIGTVEQVQREILRNQVENDYHLFDVGINYELTQRWSLTASLPILVATRHMSSGLFHTHGIGDSTVGTRAWIFHSPAEHGGNIAFGISLKMPTGKDNSQDFAFINGRRTIITSDQSIQAGDGGWGFAMETQGYQRTYFNSMLYFSGAYLFNPRGTNDVPTFRSASVKKLCQSRINTCTAPASPAPCQRSKGWLPALADAWKAFPYAMPLAPVWDSGGRAMAFHLIPDLSIPADATRGHAMFPLRWSGTAGPVSPILLTTRVAMPHLLTTL